MALAFDAVSNGSVSVAVTSLSWSHTCGGSDRVLFVSAGWGGTGSSVSGVTYNAVSMSALWGLGDTAGATSVSGHILGNPASGSNTVQVSFTGSVDCAASAQSWTGADTASPNRTPVTAQDTGSPANTTVTVANAQSGDVCVDSHSVFANATTVGAGQTSRYEADNVAGNGFSYGSSSEPATGSTVMSWTHAGTYWAIGACAIKPASAAPTSFLFYQNPMAPLIIR